LGRFSKPLSECHSDRDVLFYMIQHGSVLEELPGELEHRPYAEALAEACEIAGFSETKKQIYDSDMISERDIEAKCEYAFEDGLAKGETKGRDAERALLIAKMFHSGMTTEAIATATGLSVDTVLSYRR
jgi:predicted transposase/invertase (TIGR01784 family)